jgi:hypothetical protein
VRIERWLGVVAVTWVRYLFLVRPQVGLQFVLVGGGVPAAGAGAGQQHAAVLLHHVALQAALGDGRVVALAAVVHVLLGVRAHVEVIVHLVPEELSCGATADGRTDAHRGWREVYLNSSVVVVLIHL